MSDCKGSTSTITDVRAMHKELDEASCPICMDHPHNAVLLLCSSFDKGCRTYICDTSYRHSNCLDRFKKLRADHEKSPSPQPSSLNTDSLRFGQSPFDIPNSDSHLDLAESHVAMEGSRPAESNSNMKCPLCRGSVYGWKIVREARDYLDLKHRSCSQESCLFSGNYRELRRHARRSHPTIRPSDTDPSREHAWRRLEHQREYGDIVSAIRSAMPGAVVVGDYVIDNGDAFPGEGGSSEFGEGSAPWWTTFFLFQMVGSGSGTSNGSRRRPTSQARGFPRAWNRNHRSAVPFSSRRYLWGENLLGMQDERNEDVSPRPRRRRRFSRSRPSED